MEKTVFTLFCGKKSTVTAFNDNLNKIGKLDQIKINAKSLYTNSHKFFLPYPTSTFCKCTNGAFCEEALRIQLETFIKEQGSNLDNIIYCVEIDKTISNADIKFMEILSAYPKLIEKVKVVVVENCYGLRCDDDYVRFIKYLKSVDLYIDNIYLPYFSRRFTKDTDSKILKYNIKNNNHLKIVEGEIFMQYLCELMLTVEKNTFDYAVMLNDKYCNLIKDIQKDITKKGLYVDEIITCDDVMSEKNKILTRVYIIAFGMLFLMWLIAVVAKAIVMEDYSLGILTGIFCITTIIVALACLVISVMTHNISSNKKYHFRYFSFPSIEFKLLLEFGVNLLVDYDNVEKDVTVYYDNYKWFYKGLMKGNKFIKGKFYYPSECNYVRNVMYEIDKSECLKPKCYESSYD